MSESTSDGVRTLIEEIGAAGVDEMLRSPGLAAAVDQHSAAIRDVLAETGAGLKRESLMDYMHGFTDTAVAKGWWPGDDYDWETMRIIAVCWMVRQISQR